MATSAPHRSLSLPEQFVVLSHLDSGRVHHTRQTAIGCAAAGLAELAVRRRILFRSRKFTTFGVEVHQSGGKIHVLDHHPTGFGWADEVLAELGRRAASDGKPTTLQRWLERGGRAALSLHRQDVVHGQAPLSPDVGKPGTIGS